MKPVVVKDLMKIETPEILMLQETKIEGEALLELSKTTWKTKARIAVSTRGNSGGLATVWMEDLFQLENSIETQYWIYTELRHKASKLIIALFNLYVPVLYLEKKECWQTLTDFVECYSPMNIVIVGGLNIILDPKKKERG